MRCQICEKDLSGTDPSYCSLCGAPVTAARDPEAVTDRLQFWGGEARILSVLFIDCIGFESLMDDVAHDEALIIVHECMTHMSGLIHKLGGTSNVITADSRILGIFGAPKAHRDDPLRAARCAWQIRTWWEQKRESMALLKTIDLTIGINTGRAFFGYVLEKPRFLTVIGDTINTAARLAEMCPRNDILMSETTYSKVSEYVDVDHLGERSIKGKTARIDIYLVKALKEQPDIPSKQAIPLYGREQELEQLMDITESAGTRNLKFVVITGQMGIGKTRLKEAYETRLSESGVCRYFETHCSAEMESAFLPFKLFLKQYFNLRDNDTKEAIDARITDMVVERGLSPIIARGLKHLFLSDMQRMNHTEILSINEEIYSSIKNLIAYESKNSTFVLIFEEFNKADEMSRYLVTYLTSELKNEPVVFVLVNAPKDIVSSIVVPVTRINLGPLSRAATTELILHLLKKADEHLIEFLYNSSGGNPLFTIEAIRNTRRTKFITETDGRWVLQKEQRLPFLDDLYGVVMSTIDSLPSEFRLIVDCASVIGYSFNYLILDGLFPATNLKERLRYLVEEGYILVAKEGRDPAYVFRHNLMKDAAYTVLPVKKRKEIHHLVATLYEDLYADQLAEYYENVGHHYRSCERYGKAAHYFSLAGDKAKNLYALDQALKYYNDVLSMTKQKSAHISDDVARHVLLHLADIHEIKGDIDKMEKAATEGLEHARSAKDVRDTVNFSERQAVAFLLTNRLQEAEQQLLAGIEQCDDQMTNVLSVLYSDLGAVYQYTYEYEKSILNFNLSWNIARTQEYEKGELLCLINLAQLHKNLGNYEQALEYLQYGVTELIPKDDLRWLTQFNYFYADINYQLWNLQKARMLLHDCHEQADEIGNTEIFIKSALDLAIIYSLDSSPQKVEEYVQRADNKVSFLIRDKLLSEINLKKANIFYNRKEYDRARDFIMSTLKNAMENAYREIEYACYYMMSFIDEEKAEYAEKALDVAQTIKLPPLVAHALYRMTEISAAVQDVEKSRYYGQKALLVFDDIKFKLNKDNQQFFSLKPEYSRLLEM
jgi:class 3 adenylate cyclase/tetratricopeptide (TPR) repeat protein